MCQKKHLRGLIHYSNDSHADRRKGLINYAYQEKKLPLLMGLFVISRIGLIINDMGYIIKKNHKVHKLKGSLALKMANFFPSTIKIVDHISHDKQNVSLINQELKPETLLQGQYGVGKWKAIQDRHKEPSAQFVDGAFYLLLVNHI